MESLLVRRLARSSDNSCFFLHKQIQDLDTDAIKAKDIAFKAKNIQKSKDLMGPRPRPKIFEAMMFKAKDLQKKQGQGLGNKAKT